MVFATGPIDSCAKMASQPGEITNNAPQPPCEDRRQAASDPSYRKAYGLIFGTAFGACRGGYGFGPRSGDGNGHDTRLVSNGQELPDEAYKANDGPVIMMESCTHFNPWHRGPFGLMLFTKSKYLTENILNTRTPLYEQGHKGKNEFWFATADKSPWPEAIPGKWYCVEYVGKMNTPGKANGQIKGWLDGKIVYDIQNVMIRDADTNDFTWRRWWVGPYFHGGTNQDQSSYIDSIVIATKYIGPRTTK